MRKILLFLFVFSSSAFGGNFERVYLGGYVDHGQRWYQSGDHDFHELGGTSFRTTPFTAPSNGNVEVTACLHIRSGDGYGHSRLFNKFAIEAFTPGTSMPTTYRADTNTLPTNPPPFPTSNITLDSESLWESPTGYGDPIQYFDGSRCWTDSFPVYQNQSIQFRVMVLCGQTLHCEVSYGSTLIRRFWAD